MCESIKHIVLFFYLSHLSFVRIYWAQMRYIESTRKKLPKWLNCQINSSSCCWEKKNSKSEKVYVKNEPEIFFIVIQPTDISRHMDFVWPMIVIINQCEQEHNIQYMWQMKQMVKASCQIKWTEKISYRTNEMEPTLPIKSFNFYV